MEETRDEPGTTGSGMSQRTAPVEAAGARLGRVAGYLLAFVALTGLGLMFHYRPAVPTAYLDLVDLREVSRFGFLRQLHLWGSHAAVIVVWLHLLRTAVRGAYAPPRRLNWSIGVALMALTLLLALTGYLLPWDQEAYWGVAALSLAPGDASPGRDGSRLLAAYVLHTVALPLMVAGLTFYHLRRARRDARNHGGQGERSPAGGPA